MKNIILIFSSFFLLFSCCKEPIAEPDPFLVGQWKFHKMDSVHYVYLGHDYSGGEFRLAYDFKDSGIFRFNTDHSGQVTTNHYPLSKGQEDFTWSYDSINKTIDFFFPNGTSVGLLSDVSDSLFTMYFRCYTTRQDRFTRYYKLTLSKQPQ